MIRLVLLALHHPLFFHKISRDWLNGGSAPPPVAGSGVGARVCATTGACAATTSSGVRGSYSSVGLPD